MRWEEKGYVCGYLHDGLDDVVVFIGDGVCGVVDEVIKSGGVFDEFCLLVGPGVRHRYMLGERLCSHLNLKI